MTRTIKIIVTDQTYQEIAARTAKWKKDGNLTEHSIGIEAACLIASALAAEHFVNDLKKGVL